MRVDTREPSVLARPATGVAGDMTRLWFKAKPVPECGFAMVRLLVVDAAGEALTRASTRQVHGELAAHREGEHARPSRRAPTPSCCARWTWRATSGGVTRTTLTVRLGERRGRRSAPEPLMRPSAARAAG